MGEAVGRLETALREQRELNSGLQQQLEAAGAKALELEGQVEAHLSTVQQLEGELARRREELVEREAAVGRAKADTQRATKEAEEQRKRWQQADR